MCCVSHDTCVAFIWCIIQGPQHPEVSSVYVDQQALRMDRVVVLERGAPHSMCLVEISTMCNSVAGKVRRCIIHMYSGDTRRADK